ncbi:MAG: DinB family protein [Saprospiraceae bacterium]
MNKSELISNRLDEIIFESPWYGNNIESTIMKITSTQAVQRVNNQHNIAEILYHMIQWKKFTFQKTFGDKEFDIIVNSDADWRTIDEISQGEWELMKLEFLEVTGDFIQGLNNLAQATFARKVPGRNYTYEHLLYGITDHDIYHQGQIMLLYKMIV